MEKEPNDWLFWAASSRTISLSLKISSHEESITSFDVLSAINYPLWLKNWSLIWSSFQLIPPKALSKLKGPLLPNNFTLWRGLIILCQSGFLAVILGKLNLWHWAGKCWAVSCLAVPHIVFQGLCLSNFSSEVENLSFGCVEIFFERPLQYR